MKKLTTDIAVRYRKVVFAAQADVERINPDAIKTIRVESDRSIFLFLFRRRLYLAALITSAASIAKARIIIKSPILTKMLVPEYNTIFITAVLIKSACISPMKFTRMYRPISIESFESMGCFTVLVWFDVSFRRLENIVISEPIIPISCANCST